MNFTQTITAIADQLGLDPTELELYANEDLIGGYDADPSQAKWPVGSIWSVEGQTLYALVRALKPATVLELGTYHGCSATHLGAALKANEKGTLVCVDNGVDAPGAPEIGHLIYDELRDVMTLIDMDIVEYAQTTTRTYDFIFEDGSHTAAQVEAIWTEAVSGLLNPGGVMVSHDAMHFIVGADVIDGIAAGLKSVPFLEVPRTYLTEPSDCGICLWMKPAGTVNEANTATLKQAIDAAEAPAVEKPKRAPRKPKAN